MFSPLDEIEVGLGVGLADSVQSSLVTYHHFPMLTELVHMLHHPLYMALLVLPFVTPHTLFVLQLVLLH